jgi:hypothetical protein
MRTLFALVLIAISAPAVARAECHCACVNGEVRNICDSSIDLEKICAPRICPLVPPSVQPLQPPVVPPLGTQSCHKQQVWNGSQYVWKTICQ